MIIVSLRQLVNLFYGFECSRHIHVVYLSTQHKIHDERKHKGYDYRHRKAQKAYVRLKIHHINFYVIHDKGVQRNAEAEA